MKRILLISLLFIILITGCKPKKELTFKSASILPDGRVHVEGNGRAFENTIGIKITDGVGFLLYQGSVITNAKDMSQFGDFSTDIALDYFPQSDEITIQCFIASPKDGSITSSEEKTLKYEILYKKILIYLSNTKLNPEMLDCTKVFPVERRISSTDSDPATTAMKMLLLGPSQKEKDNGYLLVTPSNLTINYIKPQEINTNRQYRGYVHIDFGKEMMQAGGGSCRVGAIRAEITETLLQFYPGYNVIISSEGNIEEVLQP